MPSRAAYDRLQELILEELPNSCHTPGSVACVLMDGHAEELADLLLIPEDKGYAKDWEWEIEVYNALKPRARRQLENLVRLGKVRKILYDGNHGRRNFAHRTAHYYLKEAEADVWDS